MHFSDFIVGFVEFAENVFHPLTTPAEGAIIKKLLKGHRGKGTT